MGRRGYIGAKISSIGVGYVTPTTSTPIPINEQMLKARLAAPAIYETVYISSHENQDYRRNYLGVLNSSLGIGYIQTPELVYTPINILALRNRLAMPALPDITTNNTSSEIGTTGQRIYIGEMISNIGVGYISAPDPVIINTNPNALLGRLAMPAPLEIFIPFPIDMSEFPPNKRIYIGGDFYTGNDASSPAYSQWDPTTFTISALTKMKRYWGISQLSSIDGAAAQALPNHALLNSSSHSTVLPTTGGYIYYAFPKPLGVPIIYVNGFLNTAWVVTEDTVLENGVYVTYSIYRSQYKQTGTNINLKIDLSL